MSVHAEYLKLFSLLNSHGVAFCLLRDEIEHGKLVADLDILIDEHRKADALILLADLGYKIKVSDYLLPFKTVLVKFDEGEFVVLDVHFRVVQNGVLLMDSQKVLEQRHAQGSYFLPAREDFAVLLVLHNVLGKRQLQNKHLPLLHQLVEGSELQTLTDRLKLLLPLEIIPAITPLLVQLKDKRSTFEGLDQLSQKLLTLYQDSDKGLKKRLARYRWRHFRRRWSFKPRAPIYALTGVDGVGKTSLNDALLLTLNQPGGFPAVTEYMGPWGHYRLPWMGGGLYSPGWSLTTTQWWQQMFGDRMADRPNIGKTFGTIAKMFTKSPLTDREKEIHARVRSHSRLFLTLRYVRSLFAMISFMTLLTVEMYYRYFIVYRYRRRGVTVITDRYVYDLMTGRMHEMMPHYYRIRALLCKVFPKPTRVFLLYNDIETILQRKADLSKEVMREFIALYEELALKHGFEKFKTDKAPQALANKLIASRFDEIVSMTRYR